MEPATVHYVEQPDSAHRAFCGADEIDVAFRQADVDSNGSIDVHELVGAMAALGIPADSFELALETMRRYDQDGDGSLQRDEFLDLFGAGRAELIGYRAPIDTVTYEHGLARTIPRVPRRQAREEHQREGADEALATDEQAESRATTAVLVADGDTLHEPRHSDSRAADPTRTHALFQGPDPAPAAPPVRGLNSAKNRIEQCRTCPCDERVKTIAGLTEERTTEGRTGRRDPLPSFRSIRLSPWTCYR